MAIDVEITDIGSGYNRTTINNNFQNLKDALVDSISRSGQGPNQLEADIDLNSNDLLNVGVGNFSRILVSGVELTTEALSKGDKGWSPLFAVVSDGTRRVLQLTAWTGGEGTTPTTYVGQYVGASGFTSDIASGVDIRGPQGPSGPGSGDVVAANNLSDLASVATAFSNIKQAATTSDTGVSELATDAETITGTDTTRTVTPSNITAKEATVAQVRDNTADRILTTDIVTGAMAVVTLTDATTITWDMSTGIDFQVTLGGNRTLGNPTNTVVGRRGRIKVIQDATGGRTLAKGSNIKTAGGNSYTLSAGANAIDYIDYDVVSSTEIRTSLSKGWA